MRGGERGYLDRVEELAVIFQERVATHKIRRQRQLDVLAVQTLTNTTAHESKSGVFQRLLAQLLELHKLGIFVFDVYTGGNLLSERRKKGTSALNPSNGLIFLVEASISFEADSRYFGTPPGYVLETRRTSLRKFWISSNNLTSQSKRSRVVRLAITFF